MIEELLQLITKYLLEDFKVHAAGDPVLGNNNQKS